ncbi:hypothetical protein CPB85DRAFT_1332446 [Mucidula mucida]|nr:hypothetical protein CPB85DRAFT_1332446 [Mucidula mucida]
MDVSDVDSSTEMDADLSAEMDTSNIGLLTEMEAHQIFREVYCEFYEWQQADAQASIDRLACKSPDDSDSFPDRGAFGLSGVDANLIDDEDAAPPYTSCAPVSRNVLLSDHADLGLGMGMLSHIPFADHPAFDKEQFLRDCIKQSPSLTYAWQTDFIDPDVEVILMEVVKRLYNRDIPLRTMDTFLLRNTGHNSGLVWAMRQSPGLVHGRTGVDTMRKIYNEVYGGKTESVFDALNICQPAYCLFCERVACGTHLPAKDKGKRLPILLEKKARLSAEELYESDVAPCGEDCFKHLDMDTYEDESKAESDIDKDQFIIGVLKIDPDILPCDLSFTSKVPCNKIFLYRARFLSQADDRPDAGRTYSGPSHLAEIRSTPEPPEQSFSSPVHPCVHDGPCDDTAIGCLCYFTGRQCLRSCNCALTCYRRRKGCSCYVEGGCSRANQCPCAVASHECDPELCRKCGARNRIARNRDGPPRNFICNNVDVQRASINDDLISIRQSEYGSGAFNASSRGVMQPFTYLGEYHGQLRIDGDASSTADNSLARYTGRNYMFELNSEIDIDAASMGNVTRYLNDRPWYTKEKQRKCSKQGDEYANCVAEIVHANEEQHIILKTCGHHHRSCYTAAS